MACSYSHYQIIGLEIDYNNKESSVLVAMLEIDYNNNEISVLVSFSSCVRNRL